ncbi:hypothetical protein [Phreatobacter sp. AB_2022a]|uniref:hypothetical protein n=1 Tax=Phreatobacter sp. AB_2022a TaxID=3003134 RepID=UPI0022872FD4|nr:hypothetical protein [Phreatobacter sp. AB_2022a]MCZ0732938.1 hypothetical protein [Phreatobacter sp. AB_2022a]
MRILQQAFRVYAETEQFDAVIQFYEGLQGVVCERRLIIAENGMSVAKVGRFLILAGTSAQIDAVRHVGAIFYLDKLDEFAVWLDRHKIEIIHKPRAVTGGRNLTARHPDGLVVEYFEAG